MPKIEVDELAAALREAGLEGAGRDVVFPWGVKIVELEGKKALQPMSPEEYRELVKDETGRDLSDAEVFEPSCVYGPGRCISQGCKERNGYCEIYGDSGRWLCVCNY